MVRINNKRVKQEADGDVCSTHGKARKPEYLIDDGKGGMCCAAGDECKGSKGTSAGKPERKRRGKDADPDSCKWCEQGECWSHGQIEKPEKKTREAKITDIDGDVCSKHKKMRKAEFLIDDGKGGMCCAAGDECKGQKKGAKKSQVIGKFAKKQRRANKEVDGDVCSVHGKRRKAEFLIDDDKGGMCCAPGDECKGSKDAEECKWCKTGECWSHGQIEKPEKKERRAKITDIDGDVCSKHKKTRKAEFLVDDGKGGMCCAPGDECKGSKVAPRGKPARKGAGKQIKGRRGTSNTPSPAQVKAAIQVMRMANMGGGKGSRKGGGGGMWVQVGNVSQGSRKGGKGKGQRRR